MRSKVASKSPNLTIRLTEIERAELERKAKSAKQTLASFARTLFQREVSESSPEQADIVERLIENVEALNEFKTLFEITSKRLELAVFGAVAAAAMLKDNGKLTEEQATAVVIAHIDEALDAAPGIMLHRRKSEPRQVARELGPSSPEAF